MVNSKLCIMNLKKFGVQELKFTETKSTNGGFWWFRLSLGSYLFNNDLKSALRRANEPKLA